MKNRSVVKFDRIFVISVNHRPFIIFELMLENVTAKQFGYPYTFIDELDKVWLEKIWENVWVLILDNVFND